jgi:hypothetical protein
MSSQLKNSEGEEEREEVLGARCKGAGKVEIGVWGCFHTITSSSSARGNESLDESCAIVREDMSPSNENTASSTATGLNCKTISVMQIKT